ncbi:metal-dependent hydrolase [Aquimixticola soesokkakensis]|uniref:Metal-dependent hydrolase n=1 Tax=Aquimixticola soesokkakensis TaxID=1519096 RepID=A0A1Y5SF89_9RHOB|nr:MBL fold metallo-hydrolase [Aquimixticola soesokkakensis]SLN39323.1 metal-dependent hydrolase [Aquimixticola soesokkakensis]
MSQPEPQNRQAPDQGPKEPHDQSPAPSPRDPVVQFEPDLVRVLAGNRSAMTYRGTNSYLLGRGARVLIDPGPDDAAHGAALMGALDAQEHIALILVTHAHRDHSANTARMVSLTGAPVLAFGDAFAGRSPLMQRLAETGAIGGGEGVDAGFVPDRSLHDGEVIDTPAGPVTALWTPGHMGNHLCFAWRDVVFCGDLVMGWASSIISPPDGDAAAFRASLDVLQARQARVLHAGHGDPIHDAPARIEFLRQHRQRREARILASLTGVPSSLSAITKAAYADTPGAFLPAAERNTLAHLIDLTQQNRAIAHPNLCANAQFSRP